MLYLEGHGTITVIKKVCHMKGGIGRGIEYDIIIHAPQKFVSHFGGVGVGERHTSNKFSPYPL